MNKYISLYLIAMLYYASVLLPGQSPLAGPIDGRSRAAAYDIMFQPVKVNNLSTGEGVGIGDGSEMLVLSMLRTLRENMFYSEYRDLIRQGRDRSLLEIPEDYDGPRTVVASAQHSLRGLTVAICEDLKERDKLVNASNVVDHFYMLLLTFMKEYPHPVGQLDDFEQFYYMPYLSSLTLDLADRYNKQIIFSVELMKTLEIFHIELLQSILAKKNPAAIAKALRRINKTTVPVDMQCKHIVDYEQKHFLTEYLFETVVQTKQLVAEAAQRARLEDQKRQQAAQEEARRQMHRSTVIAGIPIKDDQGRRGLYFEANATAYLQNADGSRDEYYEVVRWSPTRGPIHLHLQYSHHQEFASIVQSEEEGTAWEAKTRQGWTGGPALTLYGLPKSTDDVEPLPLRAKGSSGAAQDHSAVVTDPSRRYQPPVASSGNLVDALRLANKLPQAAAAASDMMAHYAVNRSLVDMPVHIKSPDERVGMYYPSERRAFLESRHGGNRTWYNHVSELTAVVPVPKGMVVIAIWENSDFIQRYQESVARGTGPILGESSEIRLIGMPV